MYQFCVTFEIEEHYASKTEEQPAVEIGAGLEFKSTPKKGEPQNQFMDCYGFGSVIPVKSLAGELSHC